MIAKQTDNTYRAHKPSDSKKVKEIYNYIQIDIYTDTYVET